MVDLTEAQSLLLDDETARGVLLAMLGAADDGGVVTVSQSHLAALVGKSERSLRRALRRLEESGLASVVTSPTTRKPATYDVSWARKHLGGLSLAAPEAASGAGTAVARRVDRPEDVERVVVGEHLLVAPGLLDCSASNIPRGEDLRISEEFLESVRAHGVLHEVTAWPDMAGALVVVDGHRRVAAALRVGCERVPVVVVEQSSEVDRIVHQVLSNDEHERNSARGRAAAATQLVLLGASSGQLRGAGFSKQEVAAARTLSKEGSLRRVSQGDVDLDLVTLGELAQIDEDPLGHKLVESVVAALRSRPHNREHILASARMELAEARYVEGVAAGLRADGVVVLNDTMPRMPETWGSKARHMLVSSLDVEGDSSAERVESHASCPGHCVWVFVNGRYGPDGPDPSAFTHVLYWYCSDWRAYGHKNRYATPGSGATSGPMQQEQQAERQKVVATNRAMDLANGVRRQWVVDNLLGLSVSLPSMYLRYVATVLLRAGDSLGASASVFKGRKRLRCADRPRFRGEGTAASAGRALLLQALSVVEGVIEKDAWSGVHTGHYASLVRMHLRTLERWGYVLADVERELCEAVEKSAAEDDNDSVELWGVQAPADAGDKDEEVA